MKYFILVCNGLADDALAEIDGRTPLEVAKKPAMNEMVTQAKIGKAVFVPHNLSASPDVAMMTLLGYDAKQFYTGIAPLEALALNIAQADNQIAFRSDFVTVLDDILVDPAAGHISAREARILLEELKRHSDGTFAFHALDSYKNLAVISSDAETDDLDELECADPSRIISQKIAKYWPKGKLQDKIINWMRASRTALESHDVNRVRIDLGENPANMVWFWGQGKAPKLPTFEEKYSKKGVISSEALFMRGLAKALSMDMAQDRSPSSGGEVQVVYRDLDAEEKKEVTLKSKIRRIEKFDKEVVMPALKEFKKKPGETRILVTSDRVESLEKKDSGHGAVPVMMLGPGFDASSVRSFDEKNILASQSSFEPGHELLKTFLA